MLCSWVEEGEPASPSPRLHRAPSGPRRVLLLCPLLAVPGSGTQHHPDRTAPGRPSERADAWTEACFSHLPAGGAALEGARPISCARATAKGRCRGHRKDRWMSSKLLLGVHLENGKGRRALAERMLFSVFSQTSFECSRGGRPGQWKPSPVGGRESERGLGLPLICHVTVTRSLGPAACD